MPKRRLRFCSLLLWAPMVVCAPGMTCAYTAASVDATFSRPVHGTELRAAIASTPSRELTDQSDWQPKFLFVPTGRVVEFYNFRDLSAGGLFGTVEHREDSPRVQVRLSTINRRPTAAERGQARGLVDEIVAAVARVSGSQVEERR